LPEKLNELGRKAADLPERLRVIGEHAGKEKELIARGQEIFARIEAKDRIARDLLCGRLTLLQAAAQFRDLPGLRREVWDTMLVAQPGTSFSERLCWYSIDWAEQAMENESLHSTAADVTARAREELAE